MQIVHDYPPVWDEIRVAFPGVARFRPIFAWGPLIYNPFKIDVAPALIAHEEVHGERQMPDVKGWWRRYMDDMDFRLAEEIPAHVVEYQFMCRTGPRQARRRALKEVSLKLASPLYGKLLTRSMAADRIQTEALCSTPNPT